jgi:hypothetical protein
MLIANRVLQMAHQVRHHAIVVKQGIIDIEEKDDLFLSHRRCLPFEIRRGRRPSIMG